MAGWGCWWMFGWVNMALLCMCKVFPTLRGKQTVVTSLGDITTMMLTLRVGRYIRRVCTSFRALIWVFSCSTFGSSWLGATDPFLWLLRCLSRSGTITREGSVLYLFNHKCSRLSQVPWISLLQLFVSNWVAYHPGSTQTWYWSGKDCNLLVLISARWDKSWLWWAHLSIWHPREQSHFLASLGVLKKKWQEPRGLVWQCGPVAVHDCPLKCHSGGLRRLVSTLFPCRKCSHICEGIHWWQINGLSNSPWKGCSYCKPICILVFLHRAFAPNCMNSFWSFNSLPLFFVSMAARLSDLDKPQIWN